MKIEKMDYSHIDGVYEVEKACFSDPWSLNSFRSEVENPLSLWLVAMRDGKVVGYVGSQSVLDSADMMNIAVREDCRNQGVARELICALSEQLFQKGIRSLLLEVRVSNDPAICLYKKMGFVQVGLRPRYYHNPKEDAYILRKELC